MLCVQHSPRDPPAWFHSESGKVDISLLLKPKDEEEARSTTSAPASSRSASVPTTAVASSTAESTPLSAVTSVPTKRQQGTHPSESPAKKQSKWSAEEDEKIIRLRGDAMKWEDISKQLPGRSAISCRLHYQNYLERRSEWDEDRKNKLARLYERYVEQCVTTFESNELTHPRFKHQMWAPVAEEMSIPWRAAEAMHWQLGEQEMARRAGVTPFSLSNTSNTTIPSVPRSHTRSSSAAPRARRESAPRALQPHPPQLPSVAELTAGLPAYATQPPSYPPQRTSPDYYRQPGAPRR
jgi:Myb-like DNA-binding domain